MSTAYNVGIYCRLSKEDNKQSDTSLSIENQTAYLEKYVTNQGWNVHRVYTDDGVSGETFDRPQFNIMLQDVEAKKLDCVVVKDLSRFGRDYIQSPFYRQKYFLDTGVRLLSADGTYDSLTDNGDIVVPFLELINAQYLKDISRKTKAAKKTMSEQGKCLAPRPSYGYQKSPSDKHILMIDENVSHNVVRIYQLFNGGMTGRAIAEQFNKEKIPCPTMYHKSRTGQRLSNATSWCSSTILGIVDRHVYYGATVNGMRESKIFAEGKRVVEKPPEEWIIVPDTHEPIVSKEVWDMAQALRRRNNRDTVRRSSSGEVSLFSSVAWCAHCGGKMVRVERKNRDKTTARIIFRCTTYAQKGKEACHMQAVDYDSIHDAVLADIQKFAVLAVEDEKMLIDKILRDNDKSNAQNVKRYQKQIRETKNRVKEIDGNLEALFEEKIKGNLSDTQFKRMAENYEEKQTALLSDIAQMEAELEEAKSVKDNLDAWIHKVKECIAIHSLTRQILVALVDRIEVSEVIGESGEVEVNLKIAYKFGETPPVKLN